MTATHRAYWGRTYGSEAQDRRRQREKPFRYALALEALSRHHLHMSEDELEVAAYRLLARYLESEPEGTLQVLEIDEPFRVEDLIALNLTMLSCEVLCRQGKVKRVNPGWYQWQP